MIYCKISVSQFLNYNADIVGSYLPKLVENTKNDYADSSNETKVKSVLIHQISEVHSTPKPISNFLNISKLAVRLMDDLDAPQWADLIGPSPQISVDDYFLSRNIELKYREKLKCEDLDSPNASTKSHNFSKHPLNDASYTNESNLSKTPIKVASVKRSKSCTRKNSIKESTYENVLMEAMSNLQLSFKKHPGDKSLNKSCLVDSPAFQTKFKRVTRSMCADAHMNNLSKSDLNESHYVSIEEEKSFTANQNQCNHDDHKDDYQDKHKDDSENEMQNINEINNEQENKEFENHVNEQTSQIHLEVTETSAEHEISHDKSGAESDNQVQSNKTKKDTEIVKSKVVSSFLTQQSSLGNGSKKKATTLTGNAWHRLVKRRMSITNQHRLSMHKAKPTGVNKYVSMAEAVTKFQRATPQRFHTTTVKTTRTEQLRKSLKLTRAISPALTCKNRTRPITVISREEQERLELEKVRQNKIKANPVRKDILKKPAPLKKVEKKKVTNPEPFHLTQTKKGQPPAKQNQEIKRIQRTKTVPSIVSTDDQTIIVQQEEILHFGIPLEPGKTKKKNTKVCPFSFEARNKALQLKKLEKLKQMQELESQKNKAEFHARPVPAVVKTPINKLSQSNNSSSKAKVTIARSLSFEQRNKELQKKKEEKIKQLFEEEKKARIFKAQKVPEFKPVMIRGRSRDNLLKRSNENLSTKSCDENEHVRKKLQPNIAKQSNLIKRPLSIPFVAPKKLTPPSILTENQENRTQINVPKILEPKCKISQKSIAVLTELNTDKRAKQRKEFDEQIKKREMEELEIRKKNEEERILKEKAEKLELRKMTEIKARPMPIYKPINIIKSNKQLTEAKSPAWAKHKGSIH